MKLQNKNNQLCLETTVYQGKNGGIYLNWGNIQLCLDEKYASVIAYNVPDFSHNDYCIFYQLKNWRII